MHFTELNFIQHLLNTRNQSLRNKIPQWEPIQKSVRRNVWENTGFYGTTCQMLSGFPRVSVTCKAERSTPRQSRYADSDFGISFLMKRCFVVVNDENLSCERV